MNVDLSIHPRALRLPKPASCPLIHDVDKLQWPGAPATDLSSLFEETVQGFSVNQSVSRLDLEVVFDGANNATLKDASNSNLRAPLVPKLGRAGRRRELLAAASNRLSLGRSRTV